jgi:hypothetical protein
MQRITRIAQCDPRDGVEWHKGRSQTVGKWSVRDIAQNDGRVRVREVYHYSTLMVRFLSSADNWWTWYPEYVSVGNGTVSDQGGMNKMLRPHGYRYHRNGGYARVLRHDTVVVAY